MRSRQLSRRLRLMEHLCDSLDKVILSVWCDAKDSDDLAVRDLAPAVRDLEKSTTQLLESIGDIRQWLQEDTEAHRRKS